MTAIEWTHFPGYTGKSWNPVTGCQKIAQACKNCYAEAVAKRFWKDRKFTDVRTHADRLDEPLRRRKPTCWFVNSMSDLFHEDVPCEFIAAVFGVMAACPQHTFQVLTKRPERMREFFEWIDREARTASVVREHVAVVHAQRAAAVSLAWKHDSPQNGLYLRGFNTMSKHAEGPWPLPNVWLGTSIANQADADKNIPVLLRCPAAVRFVSYEPALGPVDLLRVDAICNLNTLQVEALDIRQSPLHRLDWIIVGGESGPGARPCDVAWIRSIVEQCKTAGVACFVKQLGSKPFERHLGGTDVPLTRVPVPLNLNDPKGGDPSEWPSDLRVRQFPAQEAARV